MQKARSLIWLIIIIAVIISVFFGLYKIGSAVWEITSDNKTSIWKKVTNFLPIQKEQDRIDVLVLGIRGVDDPYGGLLADSIILISYKPSTKQVALISLPRDIYVEMPDLEKKEKVNFVYAWGVEKQGDGLTMSRIVIEKITGIEIDYAFRFDFTAFQEIVDILEGVHISLSQDFIEDKQWDPPFILKAGEHVLNGEQALYYVRSRFSTSDFDRNRRQQQIILSLKDNALSLGVLTNPKKVLNILESLKRHIRTDMPFWKIKEFIDIVRRSDNEKIIRLNFDNSLNGLLKSAKAENGTFILVPKAGEDDWSEIQQACQDIFNEK